MKNSLIRLREMREYMSEAEKTAAEYFLKNPDAVLNTNIRELAAQMYVSPSTIVRLCKHLGFNGYREFRQSIIYELALYNSSQKGENACIDKSDDFLKVCEKVTNKNIASLEETVNLLDVDIFTECVKAISECNNLYLFGVGASLMVAEDAYMKFIRAGKRCYVSEDLHTQFVLAELAKEDDVAIIISYSGETEEMVRCADILKTNGTPTISITRFAPSTIASKATHVLYTSAGETLYRNGASSSRIAQLNTIDMLYTAYAALNYDDVIKQIRKTHIKKPNT